MTDNKIDKMAFAIAERLLGANNRPHPAGADWPVLLDLVEMTRQMLLDGHTVSNAGRKLVCFDHDSVTAPLETPGCHYKQ